MNQERIMQVLRAPHVSEKSTLLADQGQYVFKVAQDANKLEVKKAVESLFEVKVKSVRVVNLKGKRKNFGQRTGTRKNTRKAYVRLVDGHEIDLITAE